MSKKLLAPFIILIFLFSDASLMAQDTLPRFSVRNIGGNRIVIGWHNNFQTVKQISIQRSFDSLKNYKTILTVADPGLPENGYLDSKANNDHMFYRLYILLDKGTFIFSDAKRPTLDTLTATKKNGSSIAKIENANLWVPIVDSSNGVTVSEFRTKVASWMPSRFIFTARDGYVRIKLPDDPEKKYNIRFLTEANDFLFELKEIKDRDFKIDKGSFYRSGWYNFELYEDGVLKEKNKFFLPKEF